MGDTLGCGCGERPPSSTGALETTTGSPEATTGVSTAALPTSTTGLVTGDESAGDAPSHGSTDGTTGDPMAQCAAFDPSTRVTVRGVVRKGPYSAGAEVSITVLGPSGEATEQIFVAATPQRTGP